MLCTGVSLPFLGLRVMWSDIPNLLYIAITLARWCGDAKYYVGFRKDLLLLSFCFYGGGFLLMFIFDP